MTQSPPPEPDCDASPQPHVSFDALPGFTSLFRTYVSDFAPLAPFYAHAPFAPDARHAAAAAARSHPRDRATLTRVLARQNASWGADDAVRRNLERLADPATVAVVTGQQLGLLGGPLFTLYKTITAIQLAERLTAEGQPAVPVFWLHGEDHDFAEIASATVLDGETPVTLRYDPPMPADGNAGPVGRMVLTDDIAPLLDALEAHLPDTTDRDRLMQVLRDAYAPGTSMTDAFARFVRALFPDAGLVFLNPDDPDLKRLLVPLFQHDVRTAAAVARAVAATSDELVAAGFHAQVHVTPTNLFVMDDAGRLAVDQEGDRFRVRGTETTFTQDALLEEIAARPERFSPNVLLRPLAQDTLLPTVAYVAGPGEVAYFAQFGPAYRLAGVPMPVAYPRVSVTLVAPRARKLMARHDLAVSALGGRADMVFQRLAEARMDAATVEALTAFEQALQQAVDAVASPLGALDPNLTRSVEATRTHLMKQYEKLRTRALRAEKRRQADLESAVSRVRAHLFPAGKAQERLLSACHFLAAYGFDLPQRLQQHLSLGTHVHQVVAVAEDGTLS